MSTGLANHVAAEIRAEMARQNLSQQTIANAMDPRVSRAWISRRVTGEVPWDVAELEQVARILGRPVAQFMPTSDRAA